MKPVNLLPTTERPRAVAQAPRNASVMVIAVLGVLLLAVAGWVFTKNQVNDRQSAIATANQEKTEADQRAQGLKAFGDFTQIKQTRVRSITDLATKRFDWERFMRELALVLPDKVWVSDVNSGATSGSPPSSSGSSTPPTGSSTAPAVPTSSSTPAITIKGCAPSQKAVAATMVRLRTLYGAEEVDLKDSARADAAGAGTAAASDGAGGSPDGCGRYYEFNAGVTFSAPTSSGKEKPVRAPSRLGGGA